MPSNVTVRLPSSEDLEAFALGQWEVQNLSIFKSGFCFQIFWPASVYHGDLYVCSCKLDIHNFLLCSSVIWVILLNDFLSSYTSVSCCNLSTHLK